MGIKGNIEIRYKKRLMESIFYGPALPTMRLKSKYVIAYT